MKKKTAKKTKKSAKPSKSTRKAKVHVEDMWLVVCDHCDKPKAPRGCVPAKRSEAKNYCMRDCPNYDKWPYPSSLPSSHAEDAS